jgi:hypothetical protein
MEMREISHTVLGSSIKFSRAIANPDRSPTILQRRLIANMKE